MIHDSGAPVLELNPVRQVERVIAFHSWEEESPSTIGQACFLTGRRGDPTESDTENKPLQAGSDLFLE